MEQKGEVKPLVGVLISLVLLVGCSKTISFNAPEKLKILGSAQDEVTVNVDDKLLTLRETWKSGVGDTATVLVGEAITHAFHHDPKAPVRIEYVSSDLSTSDSDFLLLWSSTQTVYKISIMLHTANGERTLIDGIGHGVSYTGWPAQEAVEKAVVDLQKKIATLAR